MPNGSIVDAVAVGGVGYALLILELTGMGVVLRFLYPASLALLMVWYGLYFGILGRDCAEVAADRMVSLCCPHSCIHETFAPELACRLASRGPGRCRLLGS